LERVDKRTQPALARRAPHTQLAHPLAGAPNDEVGELDAILTELMPQFV
jgi:hypothetical protein